MNEFALSMLLVGVAVILFYTPYLLAKGVISLDHEPDIGEKALCIIPIYNVIKAEKTYFGKLWIVTYATIFVIFTTVLRVVVWRFMYDNAGLSQLSIILFIVGFIVFYAANAILAFTIMHDAACVETLTIVAGTILFPLGYFYIGQFLANVIRNNNAKEDTFGDD